MGLLDDAIREHLDLKRRRGADPAEIERAEREALGPVRRNREPGAEGSEPVAGAELDPALGSALDEPDEGAASDLVEESYGEEELYDEDDLYEEPDAALAGSETGVEDEESFEEDEDLITRDEPFDEEDDPHRTQLMRAADIPSPEDATAEHDVEEAFAAEDARGGVPAAAEDEDVLEETPEFLQDTPDHDRLWFEQRPPRDFDFDG